MKRKFTLNRTSAVWVMDMVSDASKQQSAATESIHICVSRLPCPKAGSRPPYDGSHIWRQPPPPPTSLVGCRSTRLVPARQHILRWQPTCLLHASSQRLTRLAGWKCSDPAFAQQPDLFPASMYPVRWKEPVLRHPSAAWCET